MPKRHLLVACAAVGLFFYALPGSASGRLLLLEVFLNDRPTNLIASFEELSDGRFAATRAELAEIGLEPSGSGNADELVPLDQVADLTYSYDEANQRIDIAVSAAGRKTREYDASRSGGQDKQPVPTSAGYGGVINYALFGSSAYNEDSLRFQGISATLDGRVFTPFGTLSQSGIVRAPGVDEAEWLRLDSVLEISHPESMISFKAGDAISGGLAWTRPVRFGGLQIRRSFELRPDLVTIPLPSASGTAAVPSAVDLFVDGVRTFSQEVDPGPFRINNLPLVSGSGKARLVVRDAAGRETETEVPFFSSSELLRPGLFDFSAEMGRLRTGYATPDDQYSDDLFASVSLRGSVSEWLTLEGHGEISENLINGGAGAVARIGSVALVSAAVSGSRFGDETGAQIYAALETRLAGVSLHASSQRTFGAYHDLASALAKSEWDAGQGSVSNQPWLKAGGRMRKSVDRVAASVPLPFDDSTLTASFTNVVEVSGRETQIISGMWSRSLPFDATLHATAFTHLDRDRDTGFYVGLQMPLGKSATASLSAADAENGTTIRLDAAKPLQRTDGSVGWRVHASQGQHEHRSADLSYRSRYGQVRGGVAHNPAGLQAQLDAEGAVVVMDGIFAANRIDDAFAVVDAGAPGVEILYENRPIARTGPSGRALLPELRSNERNKISVDVLSMPLEVTLGRTEEIVVPARKTGVLVDLKGGETTHSALVVFHGADGVPLPVGSTGSLNGSGEKFVVGYDGQAFLNGLQASNTAEITAESGSCRSTFSFAPEPSILDMIGPFRCE